MTRLAIVGLGEHTCTRILPALARVADADVVVGVDPDPAARARAARAVSELATTATVDAMLDRSDLDAVIVAVPPLAAPAVAGAVQSRGLPVFLEKPGAADRASLAALDPAAPVAAGFCYRLGPGIRDAAALVASGAVGRVAFVRSVFATADRPVGWRADPRAGGGALRDLAVHEIDLARVVTGDELHTVSAELASRATPDDTAVVTGTTRAGMLVSVFAAQGAADAARLEIVGDDGSIVVDRWSAPWATLRGPVARGPIRSTLDDARRILRPPNLEVARTAGRDGAPQQLALEEFLALVRGERHDAPSLRALDAALAVVEAAERAATSGSRVVVE